MSILTIPQIKAKSMAFPNMNKMIKSLLFISLLIHTTGAKIPAQNQNPKSPQTPPARKWTTLSGNQPLVIGRGGLSGLFPEGSGYAITAAQTFSVPDLVFLCNLQMSKDGFGVCLTGIKLENQTSISNFDPKGQKTYNVNGKDVTAWFSVDYTADQLLQNVTLNQGIYSRPSQYDGMFLLASPDTMKEYKPAKFWLNVQYEAFYTQRGINMVNYVMETLKFMKVDFLSSPEIGFLKTINGKVTKPTKVVFQLLNPNDVEPTTNQSYGTIVKNLQTIKSFASGIMVPKDYIWPVKPDLYLGSPTTLVADAHKLGLEVYADGFANDIISSYNYSYDPSAEYLQFLDKGDSVDGFITDNPPTASGAIACLANNNTKPKKGPALIISSNGARGVYPGSSDLSYQQAIDDGADIIDCSVQMTKDGVAFCLDKADLIGCTTATNKFLSKASDVPEIQSQRGIFSFDLTWSEIQSLKPQIVSPWAANGLQRNPAYKNSGNFVTLPEFLKLAKAKAVPGVLINIKNASYLASKKGLDIVGAVSSALSNGSFDKNSTQEVLIQSDDTSVLSKFKDIPSYKRVLLFDEKIGDTPKQTVEEIKKYADTVNIHKSSIFRTSEFFLTDMTNIVEEMKNANLTVFVHIMKNEFVTLALDYMSDPLMEIVTFVQGANVDGIVTEFPATANRYMRSPCSDPIPPQSTSYTILPVKPGELISSLDPVVKPPAEAPLPPLGVSDVVDPPLPAVINVAKSEPTAAPADLPATPPSAGWTNVANLGLSLVAAVLVSGVL